MAGNKATDGRHSRSALESPDIGAMTGGIILAEVRGKAFQAAGHVASCAGVAPVTRNSGTSIRGEHRSKRGNKKLTGAMHLAAFASLRKPASRTYYDRNAPRACTTTRPSWP